MFTLDSPQLGIEEVKKQCAKIIAAAERGEPIQAVMYLKWQSKHDYLKAIINNMENKCQTKQEQLQL